MEEIKIEEIKYEDIEKANKDIKYTKIERESKKTGKLIKKDYAEVHQRIKAFRKVYPQGKILTEIETEDEKSVRMKTTIEDKYGNVLSTARASEVKSGLINTTSMIENCETSAVGRALGFAGFGIDTSVATVEELQKAEQRPQQKKDVTEIMPIQEGQKQRISMEFTEEEIKRAIKHLGKKSLDEFTYAEADSLINFKDKQQTKKAKEEGDVF